MTPLSDYPEGVAETPAIPSFAPPQRGRSEGPKKSKDQQSGPHLAVAETKEHARMKRKKEKALVPETPRAGTGPGPEGPARRPMTRQEVFYYILRDYADAAKMYEICGHGVCRRARRCVHAAMPCYEDRPHEWREVVFPQVRAELAKLRTTGWPENRQSEKQ